MIIKTLTVNKQIELIISYNLHHEEHNKIMFGFDAFANRSKKEDVYDFISTRVPNQITNGVIKIQYQY